MLRRNILIFHAGALGDFVLNWPLAMGLGRMFAQSRIIYVTHASKGALAEEALGVESADMESGWQALFGDGEKIGERAAKQLAGAQMIFSFVATEGDAWGMNVARISDGAETFFLSPRPGEGFSGHATEFLLSQLEGKYVFHEAVTQMLRSLSERGVLRNGQAHEIVIHPGSGSVGKCWVVERFGELARKLKDDGREVRFVIGEVEKERWGAEQISSLKKVAPVEACKTYIDLWHVLASAAAFVGNDSGPGHLAGIAGVPTVSLFGVTDAKVWRPIGPRVFPVVGRAMDSIEVDEVLAAVRAVCG